MFTHGKRLKSICADITVCGSPLKWSTDAKYLGIVLNSSNNFACDWSSSRSSFYGMSNKILSELGSNPSINLALKLLEAHCIPILTYGLATASLSSNEIKNFTFALNVSIFVKLFHVKNIDVIESCQYYCNFLSFQYLYDMIRVKYLINMFHAGTLVNTRIEDQQDCDELCSLLNKYSIALLDSAYCIKSKIWVAFNNVLVSRGC